MLTLRHRPPLARLAARLLVAATVLLAMAPAPGLAATDFPSNHTAYHTFEEMAAEVKAVAAAHPDIVSRVSLGMSYQGRRIWAAKVSDNVATDESEPEVLFDGVHHADEHMGLEMTLAILRWLADGYGTDQRITNIVNGREIWLVFATNPDGAEFDIAGGRFHWWRKNRQPNADGSVGTDLNRNYDYRWGSGGRTSTNPRAITYHGPYAFSAPETRAFRDFLASRVVDGRQQIRASITFHEYGRLVMWPYGYTMADVPPDMTTADHAALVAIGRHMAATNGYRAEQASDLYVSAGTLRDYEYGRYRIFSYTFELSAWDYPADPWIARETSRNREAVLWLAERAWCPLSVLGTTVRDARCGAYDDDLEVARGWTLDPDGTDTATGGRWVRTDPAATTADGVAIQPTQVPSGRTALVTGGAAGADAAANDLDGLTTIRSAPITLPAGAGQQLTFAWAFAHDPDATAADHLRAIVEAQDGTRTVAWEVVATPGRTRSGTWATASVSMDAWAGTTVRIRFEAADEGAYSLVEALVDDVRVTRPTP